MVFGRKKKQEPENVADETANQENDLAVSYGNGEEVNDELSVTDSIPPPPPDGHVKDTKDAQEDSTQEESPSVGADDVAGDSAIEKEEELIKRKKMLLIASCIISFIILLGLAIKYGQVRKSQSVTNTSVELENESSIESEFESSSTSPTIATVAPTIKTTDATDATDATEVGPFADCVANEISAETTCVNVQGATAALNLCLVDDLADQFWAWVSTPARTAPVLANEWGWARFGEEAELPFLPEGSYEIGLFSNGDEDLAEYPLIASYQFDVNCREQP